MAIRPRLLVLPMLAFAVAAADASASGMSFAWIQTSSALPPSGGVPQVARGDTVVLEIRVHADSNGVRNVAISVEYDPALLHVIGYVRCPNTPGNEFGMLGGCGVSTGGGLGGILNPVHVTVIDNTIGRSGVFAAECVPAGCGQFDVTFELAHVIFEVLPDPPGFAPPVATEVTPFYEPGLSGIGNSSGNWSWPEVAPVPLLIVQAPFEIPAVPGAGILVLAVALASIGGARASTRTSTPQLEVLLGVGQKLAAPRKRADGGRPTS